MSTLKLKGSTSGYVEITAPAIAGDNQITLPTTAGTVTVKDASGNTQVGTGVTIGSPSANVFTLSTGGGERLRVDAAGSIGIAVTNPVTRFQVGSATSQSVFITSTGLVGLGSTAPKVSLDASQETDAIALPQGTTAQRPSGNSPYIRYNTTNSALEFYNGTDWVEIISDYFPTGSVILG